MKKSPDAAYRLNRRAPPPALRRRQAQEIDILTTESPQQNSTPQWTGNLQVATNDSNDVKPAVRVVDGFPVEYSCRDDPREQNIVDEDLQDMYLEFDYDVYTRTRPAEDVKGSIRSLEWSLLWNVAHNLGLHNCNFRDQRPGGEMMGRQLAESDYVISLSSLEFDSIDNSTACANFDDATPSSMTKPTTCTPVLGRMHAQYSGDEQTIRTYLLSQIEIELNSDRVRIEYVEDARFIGVRDALMDGNYREEIDSRSLSSTSLALVVSVAIGILVLLLAFLLARGTRQRQQQMILDGGDQMDEGATVVPSVVGVKAQRERSIRSSSSGDTEESLPDRNDTSLDQPDSFAIGDATKTVSNRKCEEQGQQSSMPDLSESSPDELPDVGADADVNVVVNVLASSSSLVLTSLEEGNSEAQTPTGVANARSTQGARKDAPAGSASVLQQSEQDLVEDKETHGRLTAAALANRAYLGVPPRPPVAVVPLDEQQKMNRVVAEEASVTASSSASAKASKTLQPRRKRRKKKKRVLKRVNSRNSVDEMETIEEHDENEISRNNNCDDTGSEFGSEYGSEFSEYSTEDEQDLTNTGVGDAIADQPESNMPSPIKEEPKIRPLPPPWI